MLVSENNFCINRIQHVGMAGSHIVVTGFAILAEISHLTII